MEAWPHWFCLAMIVATTVAAYANSLAGPLVFDDIPNIEENPTIRSLWPLWGPLQPPGGGSAVAGRPVVNLSLALNYAFGGTEVLGYHLVNLLIHLVAALTLFGVVWRTLSLPWASASLRAAARSIGFATALLWAVHPLQTESVTFIIQRTESLAGLFYLVALYGFVRGTEPGAATRRWLALSASACFIGVATKEILATAPLLILLYDRTFHAGTFREAWRRRGWYHGLLLLSWVPLALLMWQTQGRGGTAMIGEGVSAWMSLVTQGQAITGYLQLAIWPHPLIVDYGDYVFEIIPRLAQAWPQFLFITGLLGATVIALVKWPRWGFPGAWFFLILAPSSSFIPLLSQVRAEHRMYLPLAAVVLLFVLLLHRVARRTAPLLVVLLAAGIGLVTAARNFDYRSGLALWTATVRDRPGNPRAHHYLGLELDQAGDRTAAQREYEAALRLEPSYLDPHLSLAGLLFSANRPAEARTHVEAAVTLGPRSSDSNNTLGQLLLMAGEPEQARAYFEAALRLNPQNHEAHNNLGCVLVSAGRTAEGIEHLRRSVALQPQSGSLANLGAVLLTTGQAAEAVPCLEAAVRLKPDNAPAWVGLGRALAAVGRRAEAIDSIRRGLQLDPGNVEAQENLRALGGEPVIPPQKDE